jgi:WD40 repeat protein
MRPALTLRSLRGHDQLTRVAGQTVSCATHRDDLPTDYVCAIDFSPASKTIASVAYDCTAWIWDLAQVHAKGLRLYADSSKRRRPAHIDSFAGALPRL